MGLFTSRKQQKILEVKFQKGMLFIKLEDSKEIAYPLDWYPKLLQATEEEKADWTLKPDGSAIHWNKLDVDLPL
ncbi:MAG TPA: DUF2442 domain-containing protein [Daejeonella sp.]|nr:DUF2442 domain-containing protein [Daejeonella sp.]